MPHQTAVATLQELIDSGAFASQAKEPQPLDLDQIKSYPRAIAELGRAAAERQLMHSLSQRTTEAQKVTVAASLESAIKGILSLAKARDCLTDITDCRTALYSPIKSMYGPRRKFIMMDEKPLVRHVWSPAGAVDLQAVILEVGSTDGGPLAVMTLVMPAWGKVRQTVHRGAILCLTIDSTGLSAYDRHSLTCVREGRETPILEARSV